MKLTIKKIRYIINHKKKGKSCETISINMKISKRRVEQVWKYYSETGKEPIIGKNLGRPEKPLVCGVFVCQNISGSDTA